MLNGMRNSTSLPPPLLLPWALFEGYHRHFRCDSDSDWELASIFWKLQTFLSFVKLLCDEGTGFVIHLAFHTGTDLSSYYERLSLTPVNDDESCSPFESSNFFFFCLFRLILRIRCKYQNGHSRHFMGTSMSLRHRLWRSRWVSLRLVHVNIVRISNCWFCM